ncbi:olfactory receptor 2AT4-like [Protopterus annectens]|uniref:olfactory receptor 2AT4-like n=1 Tax=Protopterus annectens TaxID=7888 RepID=UPI001CFA1AAF|nr:olfactory receptor 2AT4-like [Protopterus annectens]
MMIDNLTETQVTEFILLGLPYLQEHHLEPFVIFLALYLVILLGNSSLLVALVTDKKLHKPMYFYIGILATLDMLLTTASIPKMLSIFLIKANTISFNGCFLQMFIYYSTGVFESFLLVVMAYDRYVAICDPLHYTSVMNRRFCIQITVGSCILSCMLIGSIVTFTASCSFCGPNKVNNLFCDHYFVVKLICDDTVIITLWVTCNTFITIGIPFLLVLVSYVKILESVIKVSFREGKKKALSTCTSHLLVVIMFYLSIIIGYATYDSKSNFDEFHGTSFIFHAILAPALNPIVYSLRNKEVKLAIKKFIINKNCDG